MSPPSTPKKTSPNGSKKASASATAVRPPPPPREPYPWKRVLVSITLLLITVFAGYYREYSSEVNVYLRRIQDWSFNKLWERASPGNAERIDPYRQELWKELTGKVLEIGPGFGDSLKYVDKKQIALYVAMEPNQFMHEHLVANSRDHGFFVQYDVGTCPMAQMTTDISGSKPLLTVVNGTLDGEIPKYVLDNAPYDYIASSLVLCSVTDVEANVENIDYLLAPGGKFVFIEHVRHGDHDPQVEGYDIGTWRKIQDWITPVWSVVAGN
ncbi:hypothetical protein FBU59_003542, partial [Linderina macrospora]